MNNLDNSEILSDEIISAIDLIIAQIPDVVFGGSIALNGVGLLNRKISDIDVFFYFNQSLSKNGFTQIPTTEILSDTVTDTNGNPIQRTGLKVNGIKVCAFKVNVEELQCSSVTFTRNDKTRKINIQNVNYAIQAKIAYTSKTPKHKQDLQVIDKILNDLLPISEPTLLEEIKQQFCNELESILSSVRLENYKTDDGDQFPLLDHLSEIGDNTISSGKEEISNIVEQIYFRLDELSIFKSQTQREEVTDEELIEILKSNIGEGYYTEWVHEEPHTRSRIIGFERTAKAIKAALSGKIPHNKR